MTDGPGHHRALADLVERCEPLVAHLVGYGLAGHPDRDGVAAEVMQRARRDVHQFHDPAGVRAWIAAQALWQVRHLRQPGLGAPVDGLTGEPARIAEAARRLAPQDRDMLSLWWLCVAGELTEAEAGRVLGMGDAARPGRDMLARLDAARTVEAALTAAQPCPGLLALAAIPGRRSEFQSRHVAECPTCASHGGALQPAAAVLAAAGPVRLSPGGARPATSTALLPRRPQALTTLPPETQPAPVQSPPVTRAPEAPANPRRAANRRAWLLGLVALAVLAAGLVVVNLPGDPPAGPSPAPAGSATATVAAAVGTGLPGTVPPADPPASPAAAPAGASAEPTAPGSGPAAQPATGAATATTPAATTPRTTTPPVAQPETLFGDDFESGPASGWSQSGGAWGVVSDGGSLVLRQTNPTPGLSRVFDGDVGWADYSLRAQVKPLSFGSSGLVGIAARALGVATYYRLALTNDGRAVLQAYAGSNSVTTLAGAPVRVAAGTWYALRIDVSGTTVTGYVNGQKIGSGTSTLAGTGRIGLQTYLATAEFDNVIVTAGG